MQKNKNLFLSTCFITLLFPTLASAQISKNTAHPFKEMHEESSSDAYLPNAYQNKKVTPAYRYFSGNATSKIKSQNAPSTISTYQANVDSLGQNIVGDAANETSIAVNPMNGAQMVMGWRQFDNVLSNFRQAGWAFSADSGQTWTFPGAIEPGLFRSDPVLDYDAAGNFYYNSLTNTPDFFCKVFTSTNGGASWNLGLDAQGGDKQWMAIDRTSGMGSGSIYSFWNSVFSTCIPGNFTRLSNAATVFEPCTLVDGEPFWGNMAIDNSGTLFIAGRNQTSDSLVFVRSGNAQTAGSTISWNKSMVDMDGFLNSGQSINPVGLLGQANIDVDISNGPNQGTIYIAASVVRNSVFDPGDVMFVKSIDNGLSWSNPMQLNTDSSLGNYQWLTTMSVAPNGRIDVVWLDTRDAAASGLDSSALYYSYSIDAGTTWSANEKISALFDPHVGYPQQDKMGDYFDMISDNTGAHLAWANTLNGEQDAYYTRIVPNISVDVKNNSVSTPISIFPNPSDGRFELKGVIKNSRIEVFSMMGQKVFSQFFNSVKNIDLSYLTAGIYTLKIMDNEGNIQVKKISIK